MQRQRFTEEQIIRILHDAELLGNVRDVCHQHNIAESYAQNSELARFETQADREGVKES